MKLTNLQEAKYGATASAVFIRDNEKEKLIGPFSSQQKAQKFIDTLSEMFKKYFGEYAEDFDHFDPRHYLEINASEDPKSTMDEMHEYIKADAARTVEQRKRFGGKKKARRRKTKKKVRSLRASRRRNP